MVKRIASALLLASLWVLCGAAQPSDPQGDAELQSIVQKMDSVQQGLKTLRVTFVQTNRFRMLKEPQVLKGNLVLRKPDTALYRYTSPAPLYFQVKDGDLLVYNPAQKRVSIQDIRRHQNRIIRYLGIGQPMEELKQNFEISLTGKEGAVAQLRLVPTKVKMRRKISVLNFWVDTQTGFLKSFEVVEAEGDSIRFDFSQWESNPPLEDGEFKVDIPPGVKVHRQAMDLGEPFQR